MLTALQRRKIRHLFDVYDVRRDGFLERDDYEALADAAAIARGHRRGTDEHEAVTRAFYTRFHRLKAIADFSRGVAPDEWVDFFEIVLADDRAFDQVVGATVDFVFELFDLNEDDVLDAEKLARLRRAFGIRADDGDALFARLDTDRDGVLSAAEVRAAIGDFLRSDDPAAPANGFFGPYWKAPRLPAAPGAPMTPDVETTLERPTPGDRGFYLFNAVLSVAALSFLGWLLLVHEGGALGGADVSFLPAVNAGLNSTAAALLVAGWVAIRQKRARLHRYLMVSAFAASALFLVSYVVYHYVHGDTRYTGEGVVRTVYFVVLISHVVLSMAVVPMALSAFYFAFRRRFAAHRKVTRVLAPIWLYVSVTGVAIYFMLR